MNIEHIAIWAKDLQVMKEYYCKYFEADSSAKYSNPAKGFNSYFLSFDNGARLEVMSLDSGYVEKDSEPAIGYAHIAFSVGSKQRVLELTQQLQSDGFEVLDGPRTTGDGYFEAVVRDPENNRVEITI